MSGQDIVQVGFYLVLLLVLVKPFGAFVAQAYSGARTPLVLRSVERGLYRLAGVDRAAGLANARPAASQPANRAQRRDELRYQDGLAEFRQRNHAELFEPDGGSYDAGLSARESNSAANLLEILAVLRKPELFSLIDRNPAQRHLA